MYPPSSGRHAMWSLHVIGREGWVWDMPTTDWLVINSSHRVGVGSVSAVCPRAGGISGRPCHEIIAVAVVAVVCFFAVDILIVFIVIVHVIVVFLI